MVEVIVLAPDPEEQQPGAVSLKGKVIEYIDPFEPVAEPWTTRF